MNTVSTYKTKSKALLSGLTILLGIWLSGCNSPETTKPVLYEGPLSEAEDVVMYYSEKEVVKVMLKAKKIFEFQNGDREFPEGIYIEFFDEFGKMTSTLRANSAYYFKEENKWRGRGAVEVVNIDKQEQLNTEELFWKQDTKKIFTDKFVTIKLQNEVIYGTGLDAVQDLSTYQIKNPEGEFVVEE
ncbi:MAG: LPS export ABC transporter periplasmic protein LptC [Cyclobacteriaceae bacterium]